MEESWHDKRVKQFINLAFFYLFSERFVCEHERITVIVVFTARVRGALISCASYIHIRLLFFLRLY